MADQVISISGIDEVLAGFQAAPKRIVKNAFAKGLAAAAVPIVEAIEARVPVLTGDLKESIKSDIKIDSEANGGVLQVGFKGEQSHVARFVEFGHREIGHKPKNTDKGKVVQPHPFLRPALAVSGEAALEAFIDVVSTAINEDK